MSQTGSRQRFVDTTAELLRERGFAATGLSEIIERSGAPKGSLYFHFPGGKDELFEAAIGEASSRTCGAMKAAFASSPSVQTGLGLVMEFLASELEASDFRAGCPVATVAAEAPREAPRVQAGVQQAFEAYHGAIRDRLVQAGLRKPRAEQLADFLLASIEGALLLAKARRSLTPLEHCRREMMRLLEGEKVK